MEEGPGLNAQVWLLGCGKKSINGQRSKLQEATQLSRERSVWRELVTQSEERRRLRMVGCLYWMNGTPPRVNVYD